MKLSLRLLIPLLLVVFGAFLAVIELGVERHTSEELIVELMAEKAMNTVRRLSIEVVRPGLNLSQLLQTLRELDGDLQGVSILNEQGRPLTFANRAGTAPRARIPGRVHPRDILSNSDGLWIEEDTLYTFARIPRVADAPGAIVVLAYDTTRLTRLATTQALRHYSLLSLTWLAVSGGIWWLFGRSLNARINRLLAAARALGSGRTEARTHLQGGDEIGRIAIAFDQMAEAIQGHHAALEDANAALHREVETRRRTEATLSESEERYRLVVANLAEGILFVDHNGSILSANGAAGRILGLPAEQLNGLNICSPHWNLVREDGSDLPPRDHPARITLDSGRPVREVTVGLHRMDGEMAWLSLNCQPLQADAEGRPRLAAVSLSDITLRKRSEMERRTNEERYRLLVENATDLVAELSPAGVFIYASPTFRSGLGQDPAALVGQPVTALVHTDDQPALLDQLSRDSGSILFRVRHADTSWHWMESSVRSFKTTAGEDRRVLVARDITERLEEERSLRQSEDRYRRLVEGFPDAVVVTTAGAIVFANSAAARFFGFAEPDLLLDKRSIDLVHPEAREKAADLIRRFDQGWNPSAPVETRFMRQDGTPLVGEVIAWRVEWAGQEARQIVIRDVTARRAMEQALKESETRLHEIIRNTSDIIFIVEAAADGSFYYEAANPAVERILGWRSSAVAGKRPQDLLPAPSAEQVVRNYRSCVQARHAVFFDEVLESPIGSLWFSTVIVPIFRADGPVQRLAVISRDISDRKRIEEELRQSQARFARVFQLSPDAVMISRAADGSMVEVNDVFCSRTGYRREDVIGRTAIELNLWVNLDDRERLFHTLRERGEMLGLETLFRGKDGRIMHGQLSAKLMDIGGETCFMAIVRDISERKRQEAVLKESEERYRLLVENCSDIVAEVTSEGRFLYLSPNVHRELGHLPSDLIGHSIFELIHPEDAPEVMRRFSTQENTATYRLRHADGSWHWLESAGKVYRTSSGDSRIVLVTRDVTDRRRQEENRRGLEQQLRQAQKMEAIGTLAGGIAHDFNNILTGMLCNVELAKLDLPSTSPVQDQLGDLLRACHRARDLVAQILTFSRRKEGARSVIQLSPIIREAMRLLRPSLPSTIEIRTHLQENCPPIVGDATQVHQVIMNLATNAAHAMRERGGLLEVALSTVAFTVADDLPSPQILVGNYVILQMRDTGHGMDAATQERIFEPFFTTKLPGVGTGLGLSVVHGIVENHGGAITVESAPGEGSTFRLYFPATRPVQPAEVEPAEPPPRGQGQRVMLVDDEEAIVRVGTRILENLGYRPTAFQRPQDALAALRAAPAQIDALVTDLTMPGLTGVQLAKEARALRPDLPILVATGYMDSEDLQHAREEGIRHIVEKPFTVLSLAQHLRDALAGK